MWKGRSRRQQYGGVWLPTLNHRISAGSQYPRECSLSAVTKPRPPGPLDVVGQGRMRSWSEQGRSLLCPSPPIPQHRANSVRTCGTELSSQMALATATVTVSLDALPLTFHTRILLWSRGKRVLESEEKSKPVKWTESP